MAIIPMPASPTPAEIVWALQQPTQVNRSEWTGRRKVTVLTMKPRWSAKVTLPPILGEDRVLEWRAFLAQLQGQANSFRLVACERAQIAGVAPLVKGAGQQGTSLLTDGWGAAGLKLKAGMFITVNDQLLQLVAPVVADGGGSAVATFSSFMRQIPADNAPIVADRPTALMSMAEDATGWTVGKGQNYAINFACEEAY